MYAVAAAAAGRELAAYGATRSCAAPPNDNTYFNEYVSLRAGGTARKKI